VFSVRRALVRRMLHWYLSDIRLVRAMADRVSRRPFVTKVRVRSWGSLCVINDGHFGTEMGVCPSTSVVPCKYHPTNAPFTSSC
jgi:hypothetical protein